MQYWKHQPNSFPVSTRTELIPLSIILTYICAHHNYVMGVSSILNKCLYIECIILRFRGSYTYDRWLKLTIKPAKLRVKSSGSAVACVRNSLYFLGGVGNMQMWSFGLRNDAWKCLSPEQDER